MKRRRKTVIAGPLVKVVEYTPQMPRDKGQTRSARRKATDEAHKALNHRTAQGRLEEKLAANFTSADYFITFTYRPGEEPQSRKEAKEDRAQYIRRLRDARKRRRQPLKWVMALENKHGAGRYHFHAIINSTGGEADIEEIISLWERGSVHIERLFNGAHDSGEDFNTWQQVARYMTKERPEDGPDTTPNGAQLYSCSRGLRKPLVITEWIEAGERYTIPAGAVAATRTESETEFSTFNYYRYMTAPLKAAHGTQ